VILVLVEATSLNSDYEIKVEYSKTFHDSESSPILEMRTAMDSGLSENEPNRSS